MDVDVDVHVHVHIHTIYVSRATQCAYKINIVSNCSPAWRLFCGTLTSEKENATSCAHTAYRRSKQKNLLHYVVELEHLHV